jgi:hypothetical protein
MSITRTACALLITEHQSILWGGGRSGRDTHSECAIRGDSLSIVRPVSSMSEMSVKTIARRSTSSPGRQLRLARHGRNGVHGSRARFLQWGNFIPPIIDYGHSGGRCSITGGYVYRGPATFQPGQYLFGDYCSGEMFSLTQGAMARQELGTASFVIWRRRSRRALCRRPWRTVYRLTRVIAESAATYRAARLPQSRWP